jgi:acetate kinase
VDRANDSKNHITISDAQAKLLFDHEEPVASSALPLEPIWQWLADNGYLAGLAAVGHRLVHGGMKFQSPLRVTPETFAELEQLVPLDPDHLPAALASIRFVSGESPDVPQIACFDTAFHGSIPKVANMYAIPRRFYETGVRRYGFHGLSYEYILRELREIEGAAANGRIIVAHLGSGASLAALRDGKSLDTSMGFTPLEGLVMGTRSGDIDPGALIYLLEQEKMSPAAVDHCLNKESGLLGVSESSADMRDLIAKASSDSRAAEAVDLFCYRAKKYLGAYAAALGGFDILVFTAGIGERAPLIRERICAGLEFLGIQLDRARNGENAAVISSPQSRVKVRVIQTNEELMIVRHVRAVLGGADSAS